jgi:hypothetical protein
VSLDLQMEKGTKRILLVEKFKEGWKIVVDHSS